MVQAIIVMQTSCNSHFTPVHKEIQNVNSHPHGEGWGETWGKFAVSMVGGGRNMGEVHPRSVGQCSQIPTNAPPRPRYGGGGGGVSLIGA